MDLEPTFARPTLALRSPSYVQSLLAYHRLKTLYICINLRCINIAVLITVDFMDQQFSMLKKVVVNALLNLLVGEIKMLISTMIVILSIKHK